MLMKLLSLILLLQALIVPTKIEPTKENLYSFYKILNQSYIDMGYKPIDATIFFDNINGSRGATYALPYSPFPWCSGKIGIGMQYKYPTYKYYGTIDILSTLAHETGHTYQAVNCDSKTVEAGATLLSLKALSMREDELSKQVFYWYLNELLEHRLEYEQCLNGEKDKCDSGYEWRPYTLAIDWLLSGEIIKASSLPKPIDTADILKGLQDE